VQVVPPPFGNGRPASGGFNALTNR
jgi:hypothetical protein